jgi:alpha-beta hydrolase superfamily lysophospholipase
VLTCEVAECNRHDVHVDFRIRYLPRKLTSVYAAASWKPDVLGHGYEMMTLAMGNDYEGNVTATLVRRQPSIRHRRAVLYVHGYNDYFFQRHVADFYVGLGVSFYALDLRKYGRSLMPHQTAYLCQSVREYYPEIDVAVEIIKQNGHEIVLASGHSTGGLILSVWADEGNNRNLIDGLILNSPYLSSSVPVVAQPFVNCIGRVIARRYPAMAFPLRLSPRYAQTLHHAYHGEWDFNTDWKSVSGTLLRPAWLAGIHEAQKRVRKGLRIRVPILVLCGTTSGNRKTPPADLLTADVVLEVEEIARLSTRLGQNVTCIQVTDAIHDVFLSPQDARRKAFDELSCWLTTYASDSSATSHIAPVHS